MRLTWLSNAPWTNYGYGQQAALFTPRITNAGHPIGIIANHGHEGNAINFNGVQVFGKSFHPWGMDIIHSHSETFKADALLTLMDIQVMEPDALMGTKWIPWFPVDHVTAPPPVLDKLQYSHARITMSKHASKEMDRLGIPYEYVPCGVDTKVFKVQDRVTSRETMKLPTDKFIVGMVAANKGLRKAFHQNIMAFAALQKKYGNCVLYLHTLDGTRGFEVSDLTAFCKALGLSYGHAFGGNTEEKDVLFADQYGLALGYSPEMMAHLYNSMDVYLGVTMGEGFGIPIIEAQACGTPVIVGDWTSMPELVFSGWKVGTDEAEKIFTPMNAFQYLPHPEAIAERLEKAYLMRGNMDYRKRAADGARSYDADKIVEKYWLPALGRIEKQLQQKTPDRLDMNLQMLRSVPA